MSSESSQVGLRDVTVARTLRRYRSIRGFLVPVLGAVLTLLLMLAVWAQPEKVAVAILLVLPFVVVVTYWASRDPVHGKLLGELFLWGFLIRGLTALGIYYFELEAFLSGDAMTYDWFGLELAEVWLGRGSESEYLTHLISGQNPGIIYWPAAFYYVFGHNLFLLDLVHSFFGAATVILVVKIADAMFGDREISLVSGMAAAFFPSMVLWTSQLLKEALVNFALCLIVYSMQRAQLRLRLRYPAYIVAALLAMFFLRFYMFYTMLVAVAMSLVAPVRQFSPSRIVRQMALLVLVIASVVQLVTAETLLEVLESETRLEKVELARLDQAAGPGERSGVGGFAVDSDVSTPQGALRHLPIGFLYYLFSPFPWEIHNLRQAITLPEGLLWWALFPVFFRGLRRALRHHLPESWIILVFTATLTFVYSVGQGNVGTAYRQRSHVLIFWFIFVALGYVWKQRLRLARALARRGGPTPEPATTRQG